MNMGYNTQLLIFNDGLGQIDRYPEDFANKMTTAIHRSVRGDLDYDTISVRGHEVGQIIPTAHADIRRVLVSHGNWLWEVKDSGPTFERALQEDHMREELLARCGAAIGDANRVVRALLFKET